MNRSFFLLCRSFLASRISFDKIIAIVEHIKGEAFAEFRKRYGDLGMREAVRGRQGQAEKIEKRGYGRRGQISIIAKRMNCLYLLLF